MKYELLTHAFYMANHLPSTKDMMHLHWRYNFIDVSVKPLTRHFIGLRLRIKG